MDQPAASSHSRPGGAGTLAGRSVARIGYGAMQLEAAGSGAQRADAVALLRRARELGVDHVDTASFYGGGLVNELIREALSPFDDDLVLVSKVGALHRGGGLVAAQRPTELRLSVEDDLRTLGTDRVDVVNLRRLDARPGLVAEGEQVVDLDDQLSELVALRDEGKLAAIGLSNVDADQLRQALPVGVACVQNEYSLVERRHESLLEIAAENDVAWVPFCPLGSGFANHEKVTDLPDVRRVAQELGRTPAEVGLAWLLARDPNVLLIPGTSSTVHLEQNLAAGELLAQEGAADALATLG